MRPWPRDERRPRTPAKSARASAWMRQLILLAVALLGHCATPMQGYQGSQDTLLTITVVDTQGAIMPNVDVILMRDSNFLAQIKTGGHGRVSCRGRRSQPYLYLTCNKDKTP